jgi:hypothetical protein
VSASKSDRSTAPRQSLSASRAKETKDRNIRPPVGKVTPPAKPKKGMRVIEAQLAAAPPPPAEVVTVEVLPAILTGDEPPPKDPWWTDEREKAFAMVLQGIPQHQVSSELARDRHTIARWVEDERFETRLYDENIARFKASRQRRTIQTVGLTDKVMRLASKAVDKALELAENGEDDVKVRFAARDWLSEFREQGRREDEVYGLDKQRVDVNVHGTIQHQHRGKATNVTFKDFLSGAMKRLGVDVDKEEVSAERADDALVAVTERALLEGTFLDDLAEREKQEQLQPLLDERR